MQKNRWMFWSGMLLTFGGALILPLIFGVVLFFVGDIEKFFGANNENFPVIMIVGLGVVVLVLLIGSLLLIGSILIPLFSKMRSKNKILTEGSAAEATILATSDTGTRINDNPVVNFTLEVRSQTQQPFKADVSQTVSLVHLPSYQPGQIINVKYIPGTSEVAIVGLKNQHTK